MNFIRKKIGEKKFRLISRRHRLTRYDESVIDNIFNQWDKDFWRNKEKCFNAIDLLLCRESRRTIIISAIGEFCKEYINIKAAENRLN